VLDRKQSEQQHVDQHSLNNGHLWPVVNALRHNEISKEAGQIEERGQENAVRERCERKDKSS
jgi:hypothetical protein